MRDQSSNPSAGSHINLTAATETKNHKKGEVIIVRPSELIAYDQQLGFTRLVLVGRRILDVKEGTDQIDRLMRTVAASVLPT